MKLKVILFVCLVENTMQQVITTCGKSNKFRAEVSTDYDTFPLETYFIDVQGCLNDAQITQVKLETNLDVLEENTFINMAKLKTLNMESKHVTELKSGFVKNSPGIEEIFAQKNEINTIENGVFNGFNLLSLNLHSNKIETIHEGAFASLTSLWLNLANNLLTEVDRRWFKNTSLVRLDLSYNRLVSLSGDAFSELQELVNIDLNYNRIHFIGSATFSGHKFRLQILHLAGNYLSDLAFLTNVSLDDLDVGFNKISSVKDAEVSQIRRIFIYPNPWNCKCLQGFWKLAWKRKMEYGESPTLRKHLNWRGPLCIRRGECDDYHIELDLQRQYFETVNYGQLGVYKYNESLLNELYALVS